MRARADAITTASNRSSTIASCPERPLVLARLGAHDPIGAGEQGEYQPAGGHELEKSPAARTPRT